jgi:hypothetical protein
MLESRTFRAIPSGSLADVLLSRDTKKRPTEVDRFSERAPEGIRTPNLLFCSLGRVVQGRPPATSTFAERQLRTSLNSDIAGTVAVTVAVTTASLPVEVNIWTG